MRKRIRLHQLREGMFVDEIDVADAARRRLFPPLLINSSEDVRQLFQHNVMSVVIDTAKGKDLARDCGSAETAKVTNKMFLRNEVEEARITVHEASRLLGKVVSEIRVTGRLNYDITLKAVDRVMEPALKDHGSLGALLKLKACDKGTFQRSIAVCALMIIFGQELGLDTDFLRTLGTGGLTRDIGIIAIGSELIGKSAKLTADEMAAIRLHPQRGYDMLSQISSVRRPVLEICLHHHERYDGMGYPSGLTGTAIPFSARLASICDVFVMLTSSRPTRKSMSPADAADRMLHSEGQFDPDLMKAFISKIVVSGRV